MDKFKIPGILLLQNIINIKAVITISFEKRKKIVKLKKKKSERIRRNAIK
jgi:hypothetical protein